MEKIWLKEKDTGYLIRAAEGTGDNLDEDDIAEGYVDYIYYDEFASIEDAYQQNTYDGGMILLNKYYKDMTTQEIKDAVEDFVGGKYEVVESFRECD